jgi:hypothetical protein
MIPSSETFAKRKSFFKPVWGRWVEIVAEERPGWGFGSGGSEEPFAPKIKHQTVQTLWGRHIGRGLEVLRGIGSVRARQSKRSMTRKINEQQCNFISSDCPP